jgi:hypothetical protein
VRMPPSLIGSAAAIRSSAGSPRTTKSRTFMSPSRGS